MNSTSSELVDNARATRGAVKRFRNAFSFRHIPADFTSLFRPAIGNVPGLDIARASAVLLVILDHFAYGWKDIGLPNLAMFGLPMFLWGWTGVDLFFVLSGCLIGQQLWREFVNTGHVSVWRFIAKRGFRIWPLYFTTLLVLLLVGSRFSPVWADWLLVSNYVSGSGFVRGWSLSTEEHFYILTPLVFLLVGRVRSPKIVALVFASGLLVVPILRLWTSHRLHAQGFTDLVISAKMYSPFHLHSEALFLGLLLAFAYSCIIPGQRVRVWWIQFALIAAAAMALALRAIDKISFAYIAMALVYGALVWFMWNVRSIAKSNGVLKVFHVIARLSFGMYLNHLIDHNEIRRAQSYAALLTNSSTMQALLSLLMVTLQSMVIATISYLLVEQPWLRLRASLLHAAAAGTKGFRHA